MGLASGRVKLGLGAFPAFRGGPDPLRFIADPALWSDLPDSDAHSILVVELIVFTLIWRMVLDNSHLIPCSEKSRGLFWSNDRLRS